jgi:hypothetical protein
MDIIILVLLYKKCLHKQQINQDKKKTKNDTYGYFIFKTKFQETNHYILHLRKY